MHSKLGARNKTLLKRLIFKRSLVCGLGLFSSVLCIGAHARIVATSEESPSSVSSSPSISSSPYWQCVTFARSLSGIRIYGDAWTWWQGAKGKYEQGHVAKAGAVLVFRAQGNMNKGHVAVISQIITDRIIKVTHANWSPINGRRGQVEENVTVVDVSDLGDWSAVRVWFDPLKDLGTRVYSTYGFIYDNPLDRGQTPQYADARTPKSKRDSSQITEVAEQTYGEIAPSASISRDTNHTALPVISTTIAENTPRSVDAPNVENPASIDDQLAPFLTPNVESQQDDATVAPVVLASFETAVPARLAPQSAPASRPDLLQTALMKAGSKKATQASIERVRVTKLKAMIKVTPVQAKAYAALPDIKVVLAKTSDRSAMRKKVSVKQLSPQSLASHQIDAKSLSGRLSKPVTPRLVAKLAAKPMKN